MLPVGSTIGIIGGGQLGRMIAHEARPLGYKIAILDPNPECPAAGAADVALVGAWDDPEALQRLADISDVVTVETEHIPAIHLHPLANNHVLHPSPAVMETIQDRKTQREFLDKMGIPQPQWRAVDDGPSAVQAASELGLPAIMKSRHGGYDGLGQVRLKDGDDAAEGFAKLGKPAVMEAFVHFDKEVSVLAARGPSGESAVYPIAHNEHRDGILHLTRAPDTLDDAVAKEAQRIAAAIAEGLDHVGVLCVELFVVGDKLLVNEVAPRVHNSGHYTLGGCVTSQFQQHARAICGLPLGDTTLLRPAAMLNLLGVSWKDGEEPDWAPVLEMDGAALHLYGKAEARPGRKMGHVLILDESLDVATAKANALHERLN